MKDEHRYRGFHIVQVIRRQLSEYSGVFQHVRLPGRFPSENRARPCKKGPGDEFRCCKCQLWDFSRGGAEWEMAKISGRATRQNRL